MTNWEVHRVIIDPDPNRMTTNGIEAIWVATDGGNDPRDLFHAFRRAFPECTISAAGPWKWYIDLFYPIPLSERESLTTHVLSAMRPGESFAHREQISHLQALPLVRVASHDATGVILDCAPFQIPGDRLPGSIIGNLSLDSTQSVLTAKFDGGDWHLRNRQLRALANYLVLRFDPNHPLTRQVIGEPLP